MLTAVHLSTHNLYSVYL